MKQAFIFLSISGFVVACGGGSGGETTTDSTRVAPEEVHTEPAAAETPPKMDFTMSPRDTYEDFMYIVAGERFPDDELDGYGEWPLEGKDMPILFFTLAYSPEWYVLVSPTDDFEYTLQQVELPDDSPWMAYQNTTTAEVYRTSLEPVDEGGGLDFVVSTEISGSGPAPDGDGMVMLDFIKSAVLRYEDGTVRYMPALSEGYNGYIGATEEGVYLPPLELASIKYAEMEGQDMGYEELQRVGELLRDLSLAPNTEYGGDMELQWIAATGDGEYVRANSSETSYFVLDRDNEFGMEEMAYDMFPAYMITSEYDTRYFTVTTAEVAEEKVVLTLMELDIDFSATVALMQVMVTRADGRWVVESEEGSTWMPKFQAEDLSPSEDY